MFRLEFLFFPPTINLGKVIVIDNQEAAEPGRFTRLKGLSLWREYSISPFVRGLTVSWWEVEEEEAAGMHTVLPVQMVHVWQCTAPATPLSMTRHWISIGTMSTFKGFSVCIVGLLNRIPCQLTQHPTPSAPTKAHTVLIQPYLGIKKAIERCKGKNCKHLRFASTSVVFRH